MNQPAAPRRPWKALAAAGAMLVAVHGAHANGTTPDPQATIVRSVGQMPLRDACPDIDADLPDALSTAWDDVDKPSTVTVTFKVQRRAVFDVVPESGSPRLFHQMRRAVHGLRCSSGDGEVHTVRLIVRFVEGADRSRVATITDVAMDDPSSR